MTLFVLDASVAAKWFLSAKDERLTGEALGLFGKYRKEKYASLFQICSVQNCERDLEGGSPGPVRRMSAQKPSVSGELRFARVFHRDFTGQGVSNCDAFDRSVYDSLYVALAVQTKLR